MNGVEFSARYSYPPCRLGHCGTRSFPAIFELYLEKKIDQWDLKKELEKFMVPTSYLRLIAEHAKKEPFDYEVVEAFWLGNQLLETVPHKALAQFIKEDLVRAGLKKDRARHLAENLPEKSLAHHSFHAMYIQFVSEKVPRTHNSFDLCRIGYGTVQYASEDFLKLDYRALLYKNKQYFLGKTGKRIRPGFVKDAERGDVVSTHWGAAIEKITERQSRNLENYTQRTISVVNEFNAMV